MFIRKSANDAKLSAKKMIKSIKQSFVENFPRIPWMDEETRHLAEEKVNSVDELIGYPDFIDDDELLNNRLVWNKNSHFVAPLRPLLTIVTYRCPELKSLLLGN